MATIYCDESGFSGQNLYHDSTPFFTYAGVSLEKEEAESAVAKFKSFYKNFQGELGFQGLLKKDASIAALDWLVGEYGSRAKVWAADKKLATAAKFFEYIFEPVIYENSFLFYQNDFNRFISNLLFVGIKVSDRNAEELLTDLQRMIRERITTGLTRLLGNNVDAAKPHPAYSDIEAIAYGYRDRIIEEVDGFESAGDVGNWIMDISSSALAMVIREHALLNKSVSVFCDASKPIRAGLDTVTHIAEGDFKEVFEALGWSGGTSAELETPITIARASRDMPGIQIADLFAGLVREVLTNGTQEPVTRWRKAVWQGILMESSMLPDLDFVDLRKPMPKVNSVILGELARRARANEDPLQGMEALYEIAKEHFDA